MFAIEIEYLTGRAVAEAFNNRAASEWPPHPSRAFSAFVASACERGRDKDEIAVLEWLERQGPPSIAAPSASHRDTCAAFVPPNDASVPRSARRVESKHLAVLPERRPRQERTFPSVTPESPWVAFVWPDANLPRELGEACDRLLSGVTYLGHSSSLVAVRRCSDPPPPRYVPSAPPGDLVLRVPFPGQLAALDRAFELLQQTGGMRGRLPCAFQAYSRMAIELRNRRLDHVAGTFDEMIVFRRREGPRLPAGAATVVATALRGAAMAACREPVPEVLSGHAPGGTVTRTPHVAFAALPAVGHRHADGHLLGVAAILPRGLSGEERRVVLMALGAVHQLTLGRAGAWKLERLTAEASQRNLLAETWTRQARRWATVTPVLLDAFPDEPYGIESERIVTAACEHVGLPRPEQVICSPESVIPGAAPWHAFLPPRTPGTPRRPRVHAIVTFEAPVAGPLLLGAGRYRGLGLCRPLARDGGAR